MAFNRYSVDSLERPAGHRVLMYWSLNNFCMSTTHSLSSRYSDEKMKWRLNEIDGHVKNMKKIVEKFTSKHFHPGMASKVVRMWVEKITSRHREWGESRGWSLKIGIRKIFSVLTRSRWVWCLWFEVLWARTHTAAGEWWGWERIYDLFSFFDWSVWFLYVYNGAQHQQHPPAEAEKQSKNTYLKRALLPLSRYLCRLNRQTNFSFSFCTSCGKIFW